MRNSVLSFSTGKIPTILMTCVGVQPKYVEMLDVVGSYNDDPYGNPINFLGQYSNQS